MKNNKRGFTLLEALVVVGIIAAVAVVTLPSLLSGSHSADLTSASQQIVASAREAQSQSVSEGQNMPWGIHFDNSTTTPFYSIFTGSSYATGQVKGTYRLPATVAFVTSSVPVGSSFDVTFSPISGSASVPATIQLYSISQPNLVSTVTINSQGQVASTIPGSGSGSGFAPGSNPNGGGSGNGSGSGSNYNPTIYYGLVTNYFRTSDNFTYSFPAFAAYNASGYINLPTAGNGNNDVYFNNNSAFSSPLGICNYPSGNCGGFNQTYQSYQFLGVDSGNNLYFVPGQINVDTSTYTNDLYNLVQKVNTSGDLLAEIPASSTPGCGGATACPSSTSTGYLYLPNPQGLNAIGSADLGLAVAPNGNVYISDKAHRVQQFTSSGHYLSVVGCNSGDCTVGSGVSGKFLSQNLPYLAIDANGNLYVSDLSALRVEKFDSNGNFLYQIGCNSGSCGSGSRNGQFGRWGPYGVAIDSNGNVYVADLTNSRIEKFNSAGSYVSQLPCSSGACSIGRPDKANGNLANPRSLAFDGSGNLYVADKYGIEKFDSNGHFLSRAATSSANIGFGIASLIGIY